jgi:hypothetical protein
MEARTAWFCFFCILSSWNPAYPETYHQYIDQNGVKCFSNSSGDEPIPNRGRSETIKQASVELQRAREQAEIEYWRAVEAKARSLRNTPETEVHRRGRPPLQGENASSLKAPAGKKISRGELGKMGGLLFQDRKSVPDSSESKKVRIRKIKLQARKDARNSNPAAEKQGKF